jgi:hypothetical protein
MLVLSFATPVLAAHPAGFAVVSESARYNESTGEVSFRIVFSQKPDFFTTDAFDRPANSFQYFIIGDSSLPYPETFDSIIRGDEIRFADGLAAIRNAAPPDDDSSRSGGWGTIRGGASYSLHGPVLRFSVPLQLISDNTVPGDIDYGLESYEFGGLMHRIEGTIQVQ